MPFIREALDGGLVTARSPSELRPGEMTQTQNSFYKHNGSGLHRAPERTTATSSPTPAAVSGLVSCAFDFVEVRCSLTRSSTSVTVTGSTINSVVITSGSPILTAPAGGTFVGIFPGASVTGTNIPASTTVLTWDSPTQITMSANATGSTTANITFVNPMFRLIKTAARVTGNGIADGTTATATTNFAMTLSTAATLTTDSKLIIETDSVLVMQQAGAYKYSKLGTDGTALSFSNIETVTTGNTLEAVHYNNLHVLMNGTHPNRVLKSDGNTRAHGLLPVTSKPALATGSGTWALRDGTGFYAYWTTEYDKVNDLESDFNLGLDNDGRIVRPPIANVSSTTTKVTITRPPRVNESATHWRVYRSTKLVSTTLQSALKEDVFPNGILIAEVALRDDNQQQSIDDGGGATSTSALTAGGTGIVGVSSVGTTWTTPSNATGAINNATYAKFVYVSGGTTANRFVPLQLTNFGITGLSAPITGITISVRGRRVGNGQLVVIPFAPSSRFEDQPSANFIGVAGSQTIAFTTGGDTTLTVGGANDLWNRKWEVADFADGKFSIFLYASVSRTGDEVWVDGVNVIVTYGETQGGAVGTHENLGDFFPAITVSPFGFTVAAGRGGKPPTSTTGDIFQDSLITDDTQDASVARYSFPTRIDAFPAPYFLNFDTKDQDIIKCIRTVGNVCIVGLLHQLFRVNYLPRDSDAEFDRQRAVERIEADHGIPGPKCATVFTLPGVGQMLVYANNYGVFMTDGYRVRPLTSDLNWSAEMHPSHVSKAIFVNDPEFQLLKLMYVPIDVASTVNRARTLVFHYAPQHLKEGPSGPELKVSGPWDSGGTEAYDNVNSATLVTLPDGTKKVYMGMADGNVRYDDSTKGHGVQVIRTREISAGGIGGEFRLGKSYIDLVQRDFNIATTVLQVTPYIRKSGAVLRTGTTKSISIPTYSGSGTTNPERQYRAKAVLADSGESMSVVFGWSGLDDDRASIDSITLEVFDLNKENAT